MFSCPPKFCTKSFYYYYYEHNVEFSAAQCFQIGNSASLLSLMLSELLTIGVLLKIAISSMVSARLWISPSVFIYNFLLDFESISSRLWISSSVFNDNFLLDFELALQFLSATSYWANMHCSMRIVVLSAVNVDRVDNMLLFFTKTDLKEQPTLNVDWVDYVLVLTKIWS